MTNDLSTLNGALLEMKDQLIYELGQKGVTASYSSTDGLLGLIGRISDIQTGGSCYHIELSEHSVTTTGSFTISATLQENYQLKSGATVTFSGGSSTVTATTDSSGVATATVTFSQSGTLTVSYGNVSDTCTVTVQTETILWQPKLDGTDSYTNYNTSTGSSCTASDGELTGRNIKFDETWSNSVDWELSLEAKTSDIYMGFSVMRSDITQIDRYCIQFLQSDTSPSVGVNYKATTSGTTVPVSDKSLVDTYRAIKVRKENDVYSIYIDGDLVKTYNKTDTWSNVCLTLYTWQSGRTMTIKNVKVIELE